MNGEVTRLDAATIDGGSFVVTVCGSVGGGDAIRLRETLIPLAATPDAHVIVDLSRALHLDSSAVGSLAAAAEIARTCGGSLMLVGARRPILELVSEWGVGHLFAKTATLREAIAAG